MPSIEQTDVAIIGGGYYGSFVANEVKTHRPDLDVTIIEKEATPFTKASSTNQGQFHMGYMYSADRKLAAECAYNVDKFADTFRGAIDNEVISLYGIHEGSEITADDYIAFCKEAGLPLREVDRPTKIFGDAIVATFATAEKTFNSTQVQKIFMQQLAVNGVQLATGFNVNKVTGNSSELHVVGDEKTIKAHTIFNVTFADTNSLHERSGLPKIPLRHDTFLHFVLGFPEEYGTTAATVVRGQYASLLPSKFRRAHVLASGKFRRVQSTIIDRPSESLTVQEARATFDTALEEAVEYMPMLGLARYLGYTLGTRTAYIDQDTGGYTSRALVFKDFSGIPNYHAVLGGKVSCMFDIAESIKEIVS